MLSNLLAMLKERFWKDKRRGSPKPHQSSVVSPYLDLAVTSEEIWLVEGELQAMEKTIARLLAKLNEQPEERASSAEEECVVCVVGRACMQTFPCGHRVLCRKCFIKTIQVAVLERKLPMRCVVCRTDIVRLKPQTVGRRVTVRVQTTPPQPIDPFGSCRATVGCSSLRRLACPQASPATVRVRTKARSAC